MFYNSLQYSGTKTVGERNCIICTNHALAQSIPPGPPRRHRATLPSSPARTPTTGLFPEGDRLEAHDEVRPTAMRFLKGTVLKRMMKCGQPQCACHRDPSRRHGPYFEWTYKVQGKTVNVKLSSQAAPLYQAATKQHRKLKAMLARMERLSRTALARLAKQAENTD